jgi:2-(acetamidomethylene)succinate hydrolase
MANEPVERRRRLPGIELCTFEAGEGRPVVFLHGITANGRVWDPVVERLGAAYRCVAVDQRGHGRSDRPAGEVYTAGDYARDVAALIADLGGGPAAVVGHSLGARNALVAGAERADLVAAVVAIDYVPFLPESVFDELDRRVGGGADRSFANLDEARHYLRQRYPRHAEAAIDRRALHGYVRTPDGRLAPRADAAAVRATLRALRADLEPALRAIRVPTLLVRGADSALVGPAAWQRTLALRPDLPAAVVAGADHYVPEVRPAETADLVAGFLERAFTR